MRPSLGEIRMFSGDFVPSPNIWAACDGSVHRKDTMALLFKVLGNSYSANEQTFKLPNILAPITGARYLICINGDFPVADPIPDPDPTPRATALLRAATGEIRIFSATWVPAPNIWKTCDGSSLAIANFKDLYTTIGTRFGGDGITTFALPLLPPPIHGSQYLICVDGFITPKT